MSSGSVTGTHCFMNGGPALNEQAESPVHVEPEKEKKKVLLVFRTVYLGFFPIRSIIGSMKRP